VVEIKKIIVILLVVLLISIMYISRSVIGINNFYKNGWGVDLPKPRKAERIIYRDGIDPTILEILHYDLEDVEALKSEDFMKKINFDDINKIYDDIVEGSFINFLNNEEKIVLSNHFDKYKILNEDNYYTLIIEKSDTSYEFLLLILDTKNNLVYSFINYL
jgi:hypothetical protein